MLHNCPFRKQTRAPEETGNLGGRGRKWSREENVKEQDGRVRGRTERESKERKSLIEGAIWGLEGNLALGNTQG